MGYNIHNNDVCILLVFIGLDQKGFGNLTPEIHLNVSYKYILSIVERACSMPYNKCACIAMILYIIMNHKVIDIPFLGFS